MGLITANLLHHSTLVEVIRVDLGMSRQATHLNCSSFLVNWAGVDFVITTHTGFGFLEQKLMVDHFKRQAGLSPINSVTVKPTSFVAVKATVVIGARVAIIGRIIVTRSKFAVKLQS